MMKTRDVEGKLKRKTKMGKGNEVIRGVSRYRREREEVGGGGPEKVMPKKVVGVEERMVIY